MLSCILTNIFLNACYFHAVCIHNYVHDFSVIFKTEWVLTPFFPFISSMWALSLNWINEEKKHKSSFFKFTWAVKNNYWLLNNPKKHIVNWGCYFVTVEVHNSSFQGWEGHKDDVGPYCLLISGTPRKIALAFFELMCDLIYSDGLRKFLIVICPVLQFTKRDGKHIKMTMKWRFHLNP